MGLPKQISRDTIFICFGLCLFVLAMTGWVTHATESLRDDKRVSIILNGTVYRRLIDPIYDLSHQDEYDEIRIPLFELDLYSFIQ